MTSEAKPPLFPSGESLAQYFRGTWWQHSLRFSWLFRRQLLVPAILFFVSSCLGTEGVNIMQGLQGTGDQVVDAGPFLTKVCTAFALLASGGIMLIVAMGICLFRLAIFSRAFLLFSPPTASSELQNPEYNVTANQSLADATAALRSHKGYLTKSWGLATLVMVPLIFIFMAASTWTVILAMPDTSTFQIPPDIRKMAFVAQAVSVISLLIMSNFSIVALAVTCMLNLSVGGATVRSLLLSITTAPIMTLLTAIVLAVCTAVSTPYVVISMLGGAQLYQPTNMLTTFAWEFWQAATIIVLYPLTMTLLLQSLRSCIQKDVKVESTDAV